MSLDLASVTSSEAYAAATARCAVAPLAREYVRVHGPEARSFVQGMVTNDVSKLEVGAAVYAALLTGKGSLVADVWVYLLDENTLILEVEQGRGAATLAHLERHLISEDADLRLESDLYSLELLGPKAEELAKDIPHAAEAASPLGGRSLLLRARPDTLSVPTLDSSTREVLRIERGVPRFGAELTETTIPLEANLERALHYSKGCYVGQEIIARATFRGQVKRTLVGITFTADAPPDSPEIHREGKVVGRLTSVARSPTSVPLIAIASLHRDHATPGTVLSLTDGCDAHVAALPFVS